MQSKQTNQNKTQKGKEVKGMGKGLRNAVILIMAVVVGLFTAADVEARGTTRGTLITNASCVIYYSNVSGAGYTESAGPVTNIVTNAYDLSIFSTAPSKQYGTAGNTLTWSFGNITNWGNLSDGITVSVQTNVYSEANWIACQFAIYANGSPVASGSNYLTWTTNMPADNWVVNLEVWVTINATVSDGATNNFRVWIQDSVGGPGGVGDGWPGSEALPPSTPDTGNARDYQQVYLTAEVRGPVLELTKSVTAGQVKPYEFLTYTIKYTNTGGATAIGVRIEDIIPANSVLVTNSAENDNSVTPTSIEYYELGSWVGADHTTTLSNTNITAVKWVLSSNDTQSTDAGTLSFTVQVR